MGWDWGLAQTVSPISGSVVRGPCVASSRAAQAMLVCLDFFLGAPWTSLCLRHAGRCSSDQSDGLYRSRAKMLMIIECQILFLILFWRLQIWYISNAITLCDLG